MLTNAERQHTTAAVQTYNIATGTVCTIVLKAHRVRVLWNSSLVLVYFIFFFSNMATGSSFGNALRPVVSRRHCVVLSSSGLHLLLGYRYDYAIHGSPYMSAHVLIEIH